MHARPAMRHAVWLLALAPCIGCMSYDESELCPVSGRVTIEGTPLTRGTIRFVPMSGRPATSEIGSDGSFALALSRVGRVVTDKGIPPGEYRISVTASEIVDAHAEEVVWLAPRRYADFRTSGLDATIDGPTAGMAIDLTWAGSQGADEPEESNSVDADETMENERPETQSRATEGEKHDRGGDAP